MCKVKNYKKREILRMTDIEIDKLVKIQGTQYDRKRKLNDKQIKQIKKFHDAGMSYDELGALYNVDPRTIRYNIDLNYNIWIKAYTRLTNGKHTGTDNITPEDRVLYKKDLISHRKLRVQKV